MNNLIKFCFALFVLCVSAAASAQVNIEINTPGVVALKQSMQTAPYTVGSVLCQRRGRANF